MQGAAYGATPVRDIPRYAVILTHNRPEMLRETAAAILPQTDWLWIVDNASDPPVTLDDFRGLLAPPPSPGIAVMHDPLQPPNLATLWRRALDNIAVNAAAQGYGRWDVALLCDDVDLSDDWYDRVSHALRANNASAASAHQAYNLGQQIVKVRPDNDIMSRMTGCAFVLPGEKGMQPDESMHWWWVDTDIDWQARHADGMVLAVGPPALNRLPNYWTVTKPNLGEQAGHDRAAFAAKWGGCPW